MLKRVYNIWAPLYTQGAPGGKVNILGDHSIGHSNQKNIYCYVLPG
jgi:hypothetical protein